MGQILKAHCSCGYKSGKLLHDVGFSFAESGIYYEPVYCDRCGIVEAMDGRSESPVCKNCKGPVRFYRQDINKVTGIDQLGFPDTRYLSERKYWHCPNCKQQQVQFVFAGFWD